MQVRAFYESPEFFFTVWNGTFCYQCAYFRATEEAIVFLAVVIPEVTEGKYNIEGDFETAEDLPARSGDKWMKR